MSSEVSSRSRTPEGRRKSRTSSARRPALLGTSINLDSNADAIVSRIAHSTPRWANILTRALDEVGSAARVVNKFDSACLSEWGRRIGDHMPVGDYTIGGTNKTRCASVIGLGFNPSVRSPDCEPFHPDTLSGRLMRSPRMQEFVLQPVLCNYMPTLAFEKEGRDYNFEKVEEDLCGHWAVQAVHLDLIEILQSIVALIGSKRPDTLMLLCCGRAPHRWATEAHLPASVDIKYFEHPAHIYFKLLDGRR